MEPIRRSLRPSSVNDFASGSPEARDTTGFALDGREAPLLNRRVSGLAEPRAKGAAPSDTRQQATVRMKCQCRHATAFQAGPQQFPGVGAGHELVDAIWRPHPMSPSRIVRDRSDLGSRISCSTCVQRRTIGRCRAPGTMPTSGPLATIRQEGQGRGQFGQQPPGSTPVE